MQPSVQPGGKFGTGDDGSELLMSDQEPPSAVDVVGDEGDAEGEVGASSGERAFSQPVAVAKKVRRARVSKPCIASA